MWGFALAAFKSCFATLLSHLIIISLGLVFLHGSNTWGSLNFLDCGFIVSSTFGGKISHFLKILCPTPLPPPPADSSYMYIMLFMLSPRSLVCFSNLLILSSFNFSLPFFIHSFTFFKFSLLFFISDSVNSYNLKFTNLLFYNV